MTEKIDKGFSLIYRKLSYRRKFLRTLWSTPIILLLFLFDEDVSVFGMSRNSFMIFLILLFIVQAVYNYYRWKNDDVSSIESANKN